MRKMFQTVRNSGGHCRSIPIFCSKNDFLGPGYYFWDSHVELAAEWGKKHYNGDYAIYEGEYDEKDEFLFDLVDNHEHIDFFKDFYRKYKKKSSVNPVFCSLIKLIKKDFKDRFKFTFIRVPVQDGMELKERIEIGKIDFGFGSSRICLFNIIPQNQICYWDNSRLPKIENLKKIFPSDQEIQQFV